MHEIPGKCWIMFRHFKLFVLIYLTVISIGNFLHAAEDEKYFVEKYYPIIYSQEDPSVFFLAGDIDIRTSLNFKRAVLDAGTPELLVLNSNGGLVYIGLDLALEVERIGLTTYIPEEFGCYSACAYVFLAGIQRIAEGELGVHQISSEDNDLIGGQITIGDVIDVLNKFGTPPELYPMMFSAKPNEMYILSQNELSDLGLQGQRTVATKHIEEKKINLGQSSIETAALDFVKTVMELSSGIGDNNLTAFVNLYADDVDYYGNSWSQQRIWEDKKSFFKRWSIRNYKMDLARSKAVCTQNNYCLVTGLIVWDATSPERNKKASGEARFEYALAYVNGKFRITKESSRVVKRNK